MIVCAHSILLTHGVQTKCNSHTPFPEGIIIILNCHTKLPWLSLRHIYHFRNKKLDTCTKWKMEEAMPSLVVGNYYNETFFYCTVVVTQSQVSCNQCTSIKTILSQHSDSPEQIQHIIYTVAPYINACKKKASKKKKKSWEETWGMKLQAIQYYRAACIACQFW